MRLTHLVIFFFVICNFESVLLADAAKSDLGRVQKNLRSLLDFVCECPEFCPSDFVFASSTRTGRFDEWIGGYLIEKTAPVYRVKLGEDSSFLAKSFGDRSTLTWIILTESVDVARYGRGDLWSSRNRYVLIFAGDCGQDVNGIFEFLWSRYSVLEVMLASFCDGFGSFLKYSPFQMSSGGSYGVVERVKMRNDVEKMRPMVFESFQNLNGYPLKVCVFSSAMLTVGRDENGDITLSGAEAEMVWSIRRGLNATFDLDDVKCTAGHRDAFKAALESVADRVTDLILTGYFEKLYDGPRSSYEFTAAGYEDKLCLIVPSNGPLPKYFLPLVPFGAKLWPALLIYSIAARLLRIFTRQASRAVTKPRDFPSRKIRPVTIIERLNSYVEFFFFSSSAPKDISERLLVASFVLSSVVFLGCYQSGLASYLSMSSSGRKPEINTLAEVAESDYPIYSKFENLLNNIFNDGSPIMNKLKRKIRVLSSNESLIDLVAYHKNIATVDRICNIEIDNATKYYDQNGDFLLHLVRECPAKYMVAYVVRRSSPLLKRLNILILRLEEAGLHNKWILDEKFAAQLATAKHLPHKKRGKVLTLENFTIAFIGLFVGLFGSLLIFVFEKIYHRKLPTRQL